ncbi:MAG: hypothetical protein Q9205_000879 [Flavoplaca limonia]
MRRVLTGVKSSYHEATRTQVGALAEAITCHVAATSNDHFIKGFEGSQVDFALSLHDTVFEGSSPMNRVFSVFGPGAGPIQIIPGECKDIGPRSTENGNLGWGINFTDPQWEHTQFVIVSSSYERDMVVVLPICYIYRPKGGQRFLLKLTGFRAFWILHQLPAFPPEYAPFVVPLTRLGEVLENIRQYAKGQIQTCFNPYTTAEFVGMPLPKTAPAEVLMPQLETWKKALKPIRFLQGAFRDLSDDFDVELCNIFPMFGDFKIKHRRDSIEIFVELKTKQCNFTRDDNSEISSMNVAPGYILGKDNRWIFSWLAQWDFLLTFGPERNGVVDEAFLFFRDDIPAEWWNDRSRRQLHWPSESLHIVRNSHVDLRTPTQAVYQIEAILHRVQQVHGTLKAKTDIAVIGALQELPLATSIDSSISEDRDDVLEPELELEEAYEDD